MRKHLLIKSFFILAFIVAGTVVSQAQIRVTEAMSDSGSGGTGTNDWFELTNLGTVDVDITGWKMDDNSEDFSLAVSFTGVTAIAAKKSVVFLETDEPDTDIPAFRIFWGLSADVPIATYPSSKKGVGLSSNGDGIVIFDATGTKIDKVTIPAATTGFSFYWVHNADFSVKDDGALSTAGTIAGVLANQVTITSFDTVGNIGSPGSAVVGGVSTKVEDKNYDTGWKLAGKTLSFAEIPVSKVQIYSISGSIIAEYFPQLQIKLNLAKGIYLIRANNQSRKIIIR